MREDGFEISVDEDRLVLERCVACKRFRLEGKWRKLKPRQAVKEVFKHASSLGKLRASQWQAARWEPEDAFEQDRLPKRITVILTVYDQGDAFETRIPLRLVNTICPSCNKLKSHYFEGFVQLRNVTPEVVRDARRYLREAGGIIKEEKQDKQGRRIDWKVTSNKAAVQMLHRLERKYLGEARVSSTLHTRDRQTSREKKRVTVTFKQYPFTIGSIIIYEDQPWRIVRREGGSLILKPLRGGRERKVFLREAGRFHILREEEREVLRVRPRVEILGEDWQPQPALLVEKLSLQPGDRVIMVEYEGQAYILRKAEDSKKT